MGESIIIDLEDGDVIELYVVGHGVRKRVRENGCWNDEEKKTPLEAQRIINEKRNGGYGIHRMTLGEFDKAHGYSFAEYYEGEHCPHCGARLD